MTFILISGFYRQTPQDNALMYERAVPLDLEFAVIVAMGWVSLMDVPIGEQNLTPDQAHAVMTVLDDPFNDDWTYALGLFN